MKLKTIFLASLFSTGALANGYWDYREVCDYEQVQVNTPITSCLYIGTLTGSSQSGVNYSTTHSVPVQLPGHTSCQPVQSASTGGMVRNPHTGQNEFVHYHGVLPLVNQVHTYNVTYETRQVEGSCRIEQVWVPLPECNEPNMLCELSL